MRWRNSARAHAASPFREFRLGDDPALAAPAAARRPPEILEVPRRLAGPAAFRLGLRELAFDFGIEPVILRQSEQKVHPVRLAPSHQLVAGKAVCRPR